MADKCDCNPSIFIEIYDIQKQGFIDLGEFMFMLDSILNEEYKDNYIDVWNFLLERYDRKNSVNGKMLD